MNNMCRVWGSPQVAIVSLARMANGEYNDVVERSCNLSNLS